MINPGDPFETNELNELRRFQRWVLSTWADHEVRALAMLTQVDYIPFPQRAEVELRRQTRIMQTIVYRVRGLPGRAREADELGLPVRRVILIVGGLYQPYAPNLTPGQQACIRRLLRSTLQPPPGDHTQETSVFPPSY